MFLRDSVIGTGAFQKDLTKWVSSRRAFVVNRYGIIYVLFNICQNVQLDFSGWDWVFIKNPGLYKYFPGVQ